MLPIEQLPLRLAALGAMATADNNLDLLRAAIARRAGVVLSLPVAEPSGADEGAPKLKHFKTRFIADGGDGFWVESVPAQAQWLAGLVERQESVGVCFRSDHLKVMFATPLLHLQFDYATSAAGPVAALLLRIPDADAVRAAPRRKTYRVPVPPHSDVEARVWVIPEEAVLRSKPPAKAELTCELLDISAAGLGLAVHGSGGKPPAVTAGERVRVQLTSRETTVLLDGRLRYPTKPAKSGEASVRAGVQFKTLGETREERETKIQLERIVNELERESIRRKKLGAA